jgi:TPP-dependent pyruvate/acetoin dehydrogenase alpha subunit
MRSADGSLDHGVESATLERIEQDARRDVDGAVEFALASPRPEPDAALEDVYAPADWLAPGRLS